RIYLRPLDRDEATPLEGTDGAEGPFFSPDGEWIGFYADNKLEKVSVHGGTPPGIANLQGGRGAAWLTDDRIVLATSALDPLVAVPGDGGKFDRLTHLDTANGDTSHRYPRQIPGRRRLVFGILKGTDYSASRIASLDLTTRAVDSLATGS